MRIGTQTNSLVNHLYSRATIGQPAPVVGMGATVLMWTDRQAATITKVTELTGKQYRYEIEVTEDISKVVEGSTHDGSAEYQYQANPNGHSTTFAFSVKSSKWVSVRRNEETGRLIQTEGSGLRIGERETYRDPSF